MRLFINKEVFIKQFSIYQIEYSMQSIEVNQYAKPTPNQALQALKEKIDYAFRMFTEQPSLLNKKVFGTIKIQQLIQFLFTAICSFVDCINIETKQQAASLISAIIKQNKKELGCEIITNFFYRALFNFKVQYKVKVFFFNSIRQSLNLWQRELKGQYEKGLEKLVCIVEKQHQNQQQFIQENVNIEIFNENITFLINWREDRFEVYSTILLLSKIFLEEMDNQDRVYCQWLTQLIRRFNPFIINQKILNQAPKVIEQLLSFWSDLAEFSFNDPGSPDSNSQHSIATLLEIAGWEDLYQSFNLLISVLSPSQYCQKYGGGVYDYFRLSINWENDVYYRIKQRTAKIYSRLTSIRYVECMKSGSEIFNAQKSFILKSVFFSLEKMGTNINTYDKNQLRMGEQFLELTTSLLIDETSVQQEVAINLVGSIILPLIQFFLEEAKQIYYNEEPVIFRKLIEDCIQSQTQQTLLALCVKIIEILSDSSEALTEFIFKNAIFSLEFGVQHRYEGLWPPMSKSVVFLMTTVLSYKSQYLSEYVEDVRRILSPAFLGQMTQIQLALFYMSLSYTMENQEQNNNILQFMMYSTIVSGMSYQLRIFAFDFLLNIGHCFFDRKFLNEFFSIFGEIGSMDEKWFILERILNTRIQLFDLPLLLEIVHFAQKNVISTIQRIANAIANRTNYNTHQIYNNLKLCKDIAHQYQICMRNPQLQKALWNVVYLGKMMRNLNYDDMIMQIACELIDSVVYIPQGFEKDIEFVDEIFEQNQFDGVHYYEFFQKAGLRCKSPNMLACITETIVKSASYVTYYPESLNLEHFVSLNNTIIVMQALLIKQRMFLSQNFKADIRDILDSVMQRRPELQDYPQIQCRLINLSLALSIVNNEEAAADIEKMVDLANRYDFHSYDCYIFLHLAGEKISQIDEKGRIQIFQIILYFLRRDQKKQKKKKSEDKKKLDTILSYIDPPFAPEINLENQAYSFIKVFEKVDFAGYQKTLNRLSEIDLAELMGLIRYPLNVRRLIKVVGSRKLAGAEDYTYEKTARPSPSNSMLEENENQNSEEQCMEGRISKKMVRRGRLGLQISTSRSKKDKMRQKSLAKQGLQ